MIGIRVLTAFLFVWIGKTTTTTTTVVDAFSFPSRPTGVSGKYRSFSAVPATSDVDDGTTTTTTTLNGNSNIHSGNIGGKITQFVTMAIVAMSMSPLMALAEEVGEEYEYGAVNAPIGIAWAAGTLCCVVLCYNYTRGNRWFLGYFRIRRQTVEALSQ
jgi:hypothetical protein